MLGGGVGWGGGGWGGGWEAGGVRTGLEGRDGGAGRHCRGRVRRQRPGASSNPGPRAPAAAGAHVKVTAPVAVEKSPMKEE
jgi:hypothetical protein